METIQIDKVRSFFSEKRRSRRQALQQAAALAATGVAGAGFTRAAAQESTLEADAGKIEFLFVQSFQGGSIAPRDGGYTVTFEHGLGQTVYFSDRPDRIVGATPTAQFLEGFVFGADNPPNAALVIATEDGGTDIAVVELTNPVYDEASHTATYDVQLLENFDDFGGTFQSDPVDLAEVASSFGAAHLLIDDCPDTDVFCRHRDSRGLLIYSKDDPPIGVHGLCWNDQGICEVCNEKEIVKECNEVHSDYCNKTTPCVVWH